MAEEAPFPEFTDPPVNETVLSIQFAPIAGFGIPHFGLYWPCIRKQFGRFQIWPALPNTTELISPASGFGARPFGLQLTTQPEVRCWYLNDVGDRLIQLQRDRFIHNWRQVTGDEAYPRYAPIRRTLMNQWLGFLDFLRSEKLEQPRVNQCEVTYVNHIEYNKGWNGYGELPKVLQPWSGRHSGKFLPDPERVNVEAHYLLPEALGRLYVTAQPVVRAIDSAEVLQVTLTARGAPRSSETDDVFAWLDLGREWIVKGFTDVTTTSIQKLWGRTK